MARPKKQKVAETFVMPTKEEDIKALKEILFEISGYLQTMKDMRGKIDERAEDIEVGFKIPKSVAKKMGKTWHAQNFDDLDHDNTIFSEVYTRLFKDANGEDTPEAVEAADTTYSGDSGPINSF